MQPTYSASEIKQLCIDLPIDYETFKAMTEVIEEDLHLYNEDDLVELCQASMIMFSRCLLFGSLRYVK